VLPIVDAVDVVVFPVCRRTSRSKVTEATVLFLARSSPPAATIFFPESGRLLQLPSCFLLVCFRGNLGRCCEFAIDFTFGSSSYQVRGSIYHAYNFQLTAPSSRLERLFDPTTLYLCLHMKPKTAMSLHIPANHVLLCYFARCSATA
jgi:hypothetical protein